MNRRSSYSKFGVRQDAKGKADRTRDGILFDSKLEMRRYDELKLLQMAGHIKNLKRQVLLELVVCDLSGQPVIVGKYTADFTYWDHISRGSVIEDVKGMRTPVYNLKKKMIEARYGIKIYEWPKRPKKVRKTRVKRDKSRLLK